MNALLISLLLAAIARAEGKNTRSADETTAIAIARKKLSATPTLHAWRDAKIKMAYPDEDRRDLWHVQFKKALDQYIKCDVDLKKKKAACQRDGGA